MAHYRPKYSVVAALLEVVGAGNGNCRLCSQLCDPGQVSSGLCEVPRSRFPWGCSGVGCVDHLPAAFSRWDVGCQSLRAFKDSTPGAAGACSESRNRRARPVDDPVKLVQYCWWPGTSLQSLRSWLLAVEFHQLLTQPPSRHLLRGSQPETPLSLLPCPCWGRVTWL